AETGETAEKLDPRELGNRLPVINRNSTVPTPENSRVVAGGKPVSTGTRNVAPNIATTCWAPSPRVLGQLRRSSGATTKSGSDRESTGFHVRRTLRLHTMTAD